MNATSRRLAAHVQRTYSDYYHQEAAAAWRAQCLLASSRDAAAAGNLSDELRIAADSLRRSADSLRIQARTLAALEGGK